MADIQDMRSVEKEWEYGTDIASKLLAHPSCTKLLGDGVKQDRSGKCFVFFVRVYEELVLMLQI